MSDDRTKTDQGYRFGSVIVDPAAKRLTREGHAIPIGGRCFDLLLCMLEQPGTILSREHIVKKVWPDVFVSDGNLRVQIAHLRKVLDEGTVVNVVGRGYVFAAVPERIDLSKSKAHLADRGEAPLQLIGRAGEMKKVTDLVRTNRLVTIVGAGGVGKSALADAVCQAFAPYVIVKVDLSPASDGQSIVTALMRALGSGGKDAVDVLGVEVPYDDDRERLVIFDSCEHWPGRPEAVAGLLRQTHRLNILCTSREPVRVPAEQLFRLNPLAVPPIDHVSFVEGAAYPSVDLFIERAKSVLPHFEVNSSNLALVADLARKLDGIPLAIELAASRLDSHGLELLTERLSGYQGLGVGRVNSKAPRHRTLFATLEWSYELLSEQEKNAFRFLSVFSGGFGIEAAESVLLALDAEELEPVDLLINLIDKSLVAVDLTGRMPIYRLLDTTRAFARERLLRDPAAAAAVQRRHATYICGALERVQSDWYSRSEDDWLGEYAHHLDDIRTALDWAFSSSGDSSLGLTITASASTLWFRMSLFKEARRRFEQAMEQLQKNTSGDPLRDFEVFAAMGASLNYTIGPAEETTEIWRKALGVAEALDRNDLRMRAYWGIWLTNFSGLRLQDGLDWAKRISQLAETSDEPADRITGHRLQAMTLTWMGEVDEASRHLDAIAAQGDPGRSALVAVHFDHTLISDASRAVAWWIQGAQDRAVRLTGEMIDRASQSKHSMSLALALVDSGCLVSYLSGETDLLSDCVERLQKVSKQQGFGPWEGWSRSYEGCLLFRKGRPQEAISALQQGIWSVAKTRWMVLRGIFMATLGECLVASGDPGAAVHALDQGLDDALRNGENWSLPELLRVKAAALIARGDDRERAIELLRRSLAYSIEHNHGAWKLRTGTDLAAILADEGSIEPAIGLLTDVMSGLVEGRARPDWRRADALLNTLKTPV